MLPNGLFGIKAVPDSRTLRQRSGGILEALRPYSMTARRSQAPEVSSLMAEVTIWGLKGQGITPH